MIERLKNLSAEEMESFFNSALNVRDMLADVYSIFVDKDMLNDMIIHSLTSEELQHRVFNFSIKHYYNAVTEGLDLYFSSSESGVLAYSCLSDALQCLNIHRFPTSNSNADMMISNIELKKLSELYTLFQSGVTVEDLYQITHAPKPRSNLKF